MITLAAELDSASLDAFVHGARHATPYHLSGWRRLIGAVFGHDASCLVARDAENRVRGLLPLVHMNSRLFGNFMVSMPYVNYGGPCADDIPTAEALVNAAVQLAAQDHVDHLEIRTVSAVCGNLHTRAAKVAMRLELPASADELWRSLGSKLRSQVKRAQKEDMAVSFGGLDELEAFYAVFSEGMRDLGTPVYSKAFFRAILAEFESTTRLCIIRVGGRPVAAGFLLTFGRNIEIPWACSLKRYNRLSPNMLLYWSVLQHACERGMAVFDFGRSSPDSGPYRFKAQWGALPVPLAWQYWIPDGATLPQLNPTNPKYQTAIRVWRRLPVSIANLLGPPIVRNLP